MAVGALDTSGHFRQMATFLDQTFGNIYVINILIGLLSSIVDNVPWVAAAMGMYPMTKFAADSDFWNFWPIVRVRVEVFLSLAQQPA